MNIQNTKYGYSYWKKYLKVSRTSFQLDIKVKREGTILCADEIWKGLEWRNRDREKGNKTMKMFD